MRSAPINSNTMSEERRSLDRMDVALWGRIRLRDRTQHPARICNMSPGGFMALTPVRVTGFAEVDIEIPSLGWKSAIAMWNRGDQLGAEFEPPLPQAVFDRFMAFQKPA